MGPEFNCFGVIKADLGHLASCLLPEKIISHLQLYVNVNIFV